MFHPSGLQPTLFFLLGWSLCVSASMPPFNVRYSKTPVRDDGPWNILEAIMDLDSHGLVPNTTNGTNYLLRLYPDFGRRSQITQGALCQSWGIDRSSSECEDIIPRPKAPEKGTRPITKVEIERHSEVYTDIMPFAESLYIQDNIYAEVVSQDFWAINNSLAFDMTSDRLTKYPGFLKLGSGFDDRIDGTLGLESAKPLLVEDEDGTGTKNAYSILDVMTNGEREFIPSQVAALHIGAALLNQSGSLTLGGYDRARLTSQAVAYPFALPDTKDDVQVVSGILTTTLKSISLGLMKGGRPLKGLEIGRQLMPDSLQLQVEFNSAMPYLYLPRTVCDAMAEGLPVSFNETLGLYLWDTETKDYEVTNSTLYYQFHFPGRAGKENVLKLPLRLLHMLLEPPVVAKRSPYFPCRPVTADYVLGRTFLQAIYLIVHFQDRRFWLAQAPGPELHNATTRFKLMDTPVVDPHFDALSEFEEEGGWEKTWAPFLPLVVEGDEATEPSPGSGPQESEKSSEKDGPQGLPMSTKIGVGAGAAVAVIIVALAAFCFFRRRRTTPKQYSTDQDTVQTFSPYSHEASFYQTPESIRASKLPTLRSHELDVAMLPEVGSERTPEIDTPGYYAAAEMPDHYQPRETKSMSPRSRYPSILRAGRPPQRPRQPSVQEMGVSSPRIVYSGDGLETDFSADSRMVPLGAGTGIGTDLSMGSRIVPLGAGTGIGTSLTNSSRTIPFGADGCMESAAELEARTYRGQGR